jgi:putative ABC transport system substrate-binding protein
VQSGLAESYSRPGRNVTGMASNSGGIELNGKQLAMLKEAARQVSKVVYLTSPLEVNEDRLAEGGVDASGIPNRTVAAAKALGITLARVAVAPGDSQSAVENALALQLRQGMNGLFVDSPFHPQAVVRFAERNRIPAIYTFHTGIEAGGLMYYGISPNELGRQSASFVDRILRGAKPGDLPFEAPPLALVVSRGAAKAIGLKLPQSLLTQADRVVD